MKKIFALILATVMLLGVLGGCGKNSDDTTAATDSTEPQNKELVILYTNDVHNAYAMEEPDEEDSEEPYTMGYAALALYAQKLRDEGKNVLLVDGGDHLQGDAVGTLSEGSYLVDIMNKVGYDLAIPGNHEFDFGMDTFLKLATEKAEYQYISCNFEDMTTGRNVFAPYATYEIEGYTVAFVGISTPETMTKSDPANFRNENGEYIYGFCGGGEGKELYNCVQKAIDQARGEGADYVIAVGHLGIEPESRPWTSYEVIANTSGLTAFLDAHSHSVIPGEGIVDQDNMDVTLVSTGTKLTNIAQVVLDLESGTVSAELISDLTDEDTQVREFTDGITKQFEDLLNEVVATSEVDLITHDPQDPEKRLVRSQETNLGDLCADAYRAMLDADIAIINGGGIRAEIKAGDVTYGNIIATQPYGNALCLVETTGQNILDALELSCSQLGVGEFGGFLHVSGLTFEVDLSVPSGVEIDEQENFVAVKGERRVKNVFVGEEALDPQKTYTLASHDFLLKSGGDGHTMFMDSMLLQESVMLDNQALINFIREDLAGVIPAAEYGQPFGQGRIKILAAA